MDEIWKFHKNRMMCVYIQHIFRQNCRLKEKEKIEKK